MTVTIMYRNSFHGGDGWTFYPITVEISDYCPKCGGARGTPKGYNFYEDGETYHVDIWDNPCGHIDKYRDIYNNEIPELKNKTT